MQTGEGPKTDPFCVHNNIIWVPLIFPDYMNQSILQPYNRMKCCHLYKTLRCVESTNLWRREGTDLLTMSAISWETTWAWSPGGPALNWDEHRGGNSTLGTTRERGMERERLKSNAYNSKYLTMPRNRVLHWVWNLFKLLQFHNYLIR